LLLLSNLSLAAKTPWLGKHERSWEGKQPGAYLGVTQWVVVAVVTVVATIRGVGWWWWWKEQCMHGHIWLHVTQFGMHTPSGHKRPLVPLAINAVVAQLARMLISVLLGLCSNPMNAVFFSMIYYYYYY
jgi:hypothetical protein